MTTDNKKTVEYNVVHADDIDELIARVNERLGDGWQLQGGVSTVLIESSIDYKFVWFLQAMMREQE